MRSGRYIVAGAVGAGALLVGGGVALASQDADKTTRCEAAFARAAERRGLSADELEAKIKDRALARVEAALAAGRVSSEQAANLRRRISAWEPCQRAGHGALVLGLRRAFAAAADYLGLTRAELRAELPGDSLATLAASHGKSVDGLKAAILAPAKERLAKAVASGRITQARADEALERLEAAVDRVVERTFPVR